MVSTPAPGHPPPNDADDPASERRTMRRWASAFAAVCGWSPRLEDLDGGDLACTFEPRFEPIELLGGTGHFLLRPRLMAHLEAMGFRWSDAGRVLTAPSPWSFNRRAARLLPAGVGYRLGAIVRDRPALALGPWLRMYLSGRVPIHLATPGFYDEVIASHERASSWSVWRAAAEADTADLSPDWSDWRFMFESLAHDLTVHALNYQLVPRAAIEGFAARIAAALPERVAGWGDPDAPGPLTLTTFFDNDLNRFCYEVWSRCDGPEDFAGLFMDHLPQLTECLDLRIEETRQGVGDVLDEDTRNLAPLSPWEFTLKPRAEPPPPPAPPPTVRAPDPEPAEPGPAREPGPVFRDPPSPDGHARALRAQIAHVLARAPHLPVDLPAFGLRLLDVTADEDSVSLLLGHAQPVAALRIASPGPSAPLSVTAVELHEAYGRHARELGVMADRLRRAITPAQWEEARGYARALRALPVGVPPQHFRQLVPGHPFPSGLIRVGVRGVVGFEGRPVLDWIEDLASAGARSLVLAGGEPTLDPRLERYLKHARSRGITTITLETDAARCAHDGLAARLRAAGLTDAVVPPSDDADVAAGVRALRAAGVAVRVRDASPGEDASGVHEGQAAEHPARAL